MLEPIEESGTIEQKTKRKRKLVVDYQKELTSYIIKKQLAHYRHCPSNVCLPTSDKKGSLLEGGGGCEQLFLCPTFPFVASSLARLVTAPYTTKIPGEPPRYLANLQDTWRTTKIPGEPPRYLANLQDTWRTTKIPGEPPRYLGNLQDTWQTSKIPGEPPRYLANLQKRHSSISCRMLKKAGQNLVMGIL